MILDTLRSVPAMSEQSTGSFVASDPARSVTTEGEAFASAATRLRYVDVPAPRVGEIRAVAPGVRWTRIPLPIDLNHINVWLLDTPDGCVVIDTGMSADTARAAWKALEAAHLVDRPLRAILITHVHPDHIGLAGWLQRRHGAPVLMSRRTHELALAWLDDEPRCAREAEAFFRAHGVTDGESLRPMSGARRFDHLASGMPHVERFVADDEVLPFLGGTWRALETGGHAEGHLCLFQPATRVLISGDQVLPGISPNIGLTWRNDDANPLGTYLESLERLAALDDDTLVLPSHGMPFYGLRQRADDLRRHHHEQLAALAQACAEPKTAAETLPVLFPRELKGLHLFLALTEAVAHLEYLAQAGRATRRVDVYGTIRYTTS